ncbi:hypothetical protein AGABI2DRAFT_119942 [Agaricus bisporus var. bisporus H97]|uniref:hypothetical protein n=1 Tax=Agaricus bisporus var. bisporus (strain H97 / ATCC MYA-4626 / FGSC 10389) TaxID=936046 RepID=UPI00029F5DCE|nr:hypothetical protein AGABI2DRAFT_119942 [Agaricus bisporus var. bisporus H97]EKV44972.1 hypothetical protein AGABI2DRAFT_119942 [Agaricus bisporus var. bisporus H97]
MPGRGLAVSFVWLSLTAIVWRYRPLHWVPTHSFTSSIYWTLRSWLWNYPITPDFGIWVVGDTTDRQRFFKEKARTRLIWTFLELYFAQRGYNLYVSSEESTYVVLPARRMIDPRELSYPYAQYCCNDERELEFICSAARVWPARDADGRDVVIKYGVFHSIIFMLFILKGGIDGWSHCVQCDFVTVAEIIRYARAYFETVAFLHENNITHGDILLQNMCMDVLMPQPFLERYYTGYHTSERRYVLIDFEGAEIHTGPGPYSLEFQNSRKRDIYLLADSLGVNLRCIEHVIPRIGRLLDSMMAEDSEVTATTALFRFEEICSGLTMEDLNLAVAAHQFSHGKLQYRQNPPVNQPVLGLN